MVSEEQVAHFHRQGFFFIPNAFGTERMRAVDQRQNEIGPEWESRVFPEGYNRGACQFLMMGEVLLQLVEMPEIVDMARCLLDCDEVHVGACGLGDAGKTVSEGKAQHQVHWHADGGPEIKQVSLRTALDHHGPDNGPLRVLPGSHLRARTEVAEELRQLELATGTHDADPAQCFATHPHEVAVHLDPRWTLVWTPSAWHATGVKTAAGPRRAMAWNYFPAGGRKRDVETLKYLYADEWEGWSAARQRLWGLVD
jgi:hypothetical protein